MKNFKLSGTFLLFCFFVFSLQISAQSFNRINNRFSLNRDSVLKGSNRFSALHQIKSIADIGHKGAGRSLAGNNPGPLLDSIYMYDYNSPADSVFQGKDCYYYNADGLDTAAINYFFNSTDSSYLISKNVKNYNASGLDTLVVNYSWDPVYNQWEKEYGQRIQYNANGLDTCLINYMYSGNLSMTTGKTSYFYNGNGLDTTYIFYVWDSGQDNWDPSLKEVNSFNSKGLDTQSVEYNIPLGYPVTITGTVTCFYNASGQDTLLISLSDQEFNVSTNLKIRCGYISQTNFSFITTYNWDTLKNQWIGFLKDTFLYNASGLQTCETISMFDTTLNQWVLSQKFFSFWDTTTTGLKNSIGSSVSVYPNPVKDVLKVSFTGTPNRISLYDLSGKEVYTVIPTGSSTEIGMSGYPRGAYIIRIVSSQGITSQKIIKQ